MRISDWSSDVCSSDSPDVLQHRLCAPLGARRKLPARQAASRRRAGGAARAAPLPGVSELPRLQAGGVAKVRDPHRPGGTAVSPPGRLHAALCGLAASLPRHPALVRYSTPLYSIHLFSSLFPSSSFLFSFFFFSLF